MADVSAGLKPEAGVELRGDDVGALHLHPRRAAYRIVMDGVGITRGAGRVAADLKRRAERASGLSGRSAAQRQTSRQAGGQARIEMRRCAASTGTALASDGRRDRPSRTRQKQREDRLARLAHRSDSQDIVIPAERQVVRCPLRGCIPRGDHHDDETRPAGACVRRHSGRSKASSARWARCRRRVMSSSNGAPWQISAGRRVAGSREIQELLTVGVGERLRVRRPRAGDLVEVVPSRVPRPLCRGCRE